MNYAINRCLNDRKELIEKGYWVRTEMNEDRISNFVGQINSSGIRERQLYQNNYYMTHNVVNVITYPTP